MPKTHFGKRKKSAKTQGRKRSRGDVKNLFTSNTLEENQAVLAESTNDEGGGFISFYDAAMSGFQDEALRLFESGAAENFSTEFGKTVLHLASELLNEKLMDKILEKDISVVNVKDTKGRTALHIIARANITDPLEIEFRFGYKSKYEYRAPRAKPEDLALKLLSKGADVNVTNGAGGTPLHCAAENQNPEMVKILVEHGADPDAVNSSGNTALHVVIHNARNCLEYSDKIVKLLLENGANVHAKDGGGQTAMNYIIKNYHVLFRKRNMDLFAQVLIWGGSLFELDQYGDRLLDFIIIPWNLTSGIDDFVDMQRVVTEYIIALQFANLDTSKYNVVRQRIEFIDFYKISDIARSHIEEMKKVKSGDYSLYDVFSKYNDPLFIFDKGLEECVKKARYPLYLLDYESILKARFASAQKRFKMMSECQSKFTAKLPNEIVWKILVLLGDEDLESVSRAIGN